MATTTSSQPSPVSLGKPSPKQRPDGTQRRLFRSISRFLSGGKSRPKLQTTARPSPSSPSTGRGSRGGSPRSDDDSENAVPLRDVRTNSMSTRSHRAPSASTSASDARGGDDDPDDGASRLSFVSGADTDASVRPISPTSLAPSSIASHSHSHTNSTSNASYAPTHRTYKSYASTKPTTLLSIDSGGGANRIAVVPGTGATPLPTSHSGGSLSPPGSSSAHNNSTSSPLHSSTTTTPPPSSPTTLPSPTSLSPASDSGMQVPRHTLAHPRNNPHPASPPPDNASMLTLASSSFAPSIFLSRNSGQPSPGYALSGLRTSTRIEADEDASVRALAPSRRASDESIGSRSTWSAAVLGGPTGRGTASLRTVGTGGTGGDILSPTGADGPTMAGGETEAQRVVRKEGEEEGTSLDKDNVVAPSPSPSSTPITPEERSTTTTSPSSESEPESAAPSSTSEDTTTTPPAIGSSTDGTKSPLADSTLHPTSPTSTLLNEEHHQTPLVSKGGATFAAAVVPHSEHQDEDEIEGLKTPKRKNVGDDHKDAQSILSVATGDETDAQSFVDARSVVGEEEP